MPRHLKNFLLFLVVSWVFRILYLCLFYDRYSFDLAMWSHIGDLLLAGENPYHATDRLDWPPVWMQLIFLFEKISLFTHWPFIDVVRGFLIVTETALAGLLYAAIVRFTPARDVTKTLIIGMAIDPICLVQVCQHGNFDVLVGFWILLAVYMLLRFQEHHESRFWLFACFALGMGAVTKTVPLCLAPLLLISVRRLKLAELMLGAAFLFGPITLGLSVLYVLTPEDIVTKVIGYRSSQGYFGFSGLFHIFGAEHWQRIWSQVFEVVYGTGWLALSVWLQSRETLGGRQIVSLAAGLLLAIAALGPGYGLQYIYWFLPLLVFQYELVERKTRYFLLALYAVAAITYVIEYALNYDAYGAFLLDLTRNETLLKWSATISTQTGEALLCLPLWLFYCWAVFVCGAETGREMIHDFKIRRRRV
jgi:hypothetical protein